MYEAQSNCCRIYEGERESLEMSGWKVNEGRIGARKRENK